MTQSSLRRADVYRGMGRNTAEAANQGMATREASNPNMTELGGAAAVGAPTQGSPAAVVVVLILMFAALRIVSIKSGDESDYAGIAPSFYNIMLITIAGMLGGTLLKLAVVKTLPENNALRKFVIQG